MRHNNLSPPDDEDSNWCEVVIDDNYIASKSYGDRIADVTTFIVGIDLRDFAGDDP